jgi:hyperosmotically inducible periplasmic protein
MKIWRTTLAFAAAVVIGAPGLAGSAAEKSASESAKRAADEAGKAVKETARKTGEVVSDGWITTKVKSQFVGEDVLSGSSINVDTKDSAVTLNGTVPSEAARNRALEIARTTEGVTKVIDELHTPRNR